MAITLDDHIQAGATHALGIIEIMSAQHGDDVAKAFAGGLVSGVRNFILKTYGSRCAFDLFDGMAESSIAVELAPLLIEAEIGAIVRDLKKGA